MREQHGRGTEHEEGRVVNQVQEARGVNIRESDNLGGEKCLSGAGSEE